MSKKASNILTTEKEEAKAIEKALRSYGYLFPQTDDEIESLDKIIGSTASPLPDSLKDTSFLFKKKNEDKTKVIQLPTECEDYHQAYAARDGQDSISPETKAKMDMDIKNLKDKLAKQKKPKKK